jgi:hypothetical protein
MNNLDDVRKKYRIKWMQLNIPVIKEIKLVSEKLGDKQNGIEK